MKLACSLVLDLEQLQSTWWYKTREAGYAVSLPAVLLLIILIDWVHRYLFHAPHSIVKIKTRKLRTTPVVPYDSYDMAPQPIRPCEWQSGHSGSCSRLPWPQQTGMPMPGSCHQAAFSFFDPPCNTDRTVDTQWKHHATTPQHATTPDFEVLLSALPLASSSFLPK